MQQLFLFSFPVWNFGGYRFGVPKGDSNVVLDLDLLLVRACFAAVVLLLFKLVIWCYLAFKT